MIANASPASAKPMKILAFLFAFLVLLALAVPSAFASATTIYITPTGAPQGNCTTNVQSAGFFNNGANWGTASNQIGPGTTVLFCGTFNTAVGTTMFQAQGDGAQGSPVTLKFDTGTVWQSPAATAFLVLDGHSHIVVDGGTTCGWINQAVTSCNGVIQNTANGTNLANQVYGSIAISAGGSDDIEIRNLHIGPIYVKVGTADSLAGAPGPRCVLFGNGAGTTHTGINIHNNIMHDVGWCLNGFVNNLSVSNNEMYSLDHGLGFGLASNATSTVSGIAFHDNHVHDVTSWDNDTGAFHHDAVHIFIYAADNSTFNSNNVATGINVYNNRFDGDWGSGPGGPTGNIFFEGNVQNANVFNNVSIIKAPRLIPNGPFNGYGRNVNYFNNTTIGPGAAYQNNFYSTFTGPGQTIKNNVWTDGWMVRTSKPFPRDCLTIGNCQNTSYTFATNAYIAPADFGNGLGFCPTLPNNVQYYDASSGCQNFLNFTAAGFASFETGTGETGGIFSDAVPTSTYFNTNTGQELTGAITIGKGSNLSSLCTKNRGSLPDALCSDILGNPRPANAAWDIGAYQFYVPPAAPGAVTVAVQ